MKIIKLAAITLCSITFIVETVQALGRGCVPCQAAAKARKNKQK